MVYPALLPLMGTPRLPVVDWTDAPADLNGLVLLARKTKSGFCACAITFQMQSTTSMDRILREMYLGRSKDETNRRDSQGTSTSFGMWSHTLVLKVSLGLATETWRLKLRLADGKRFPVLAERLSLSQLVLVLQLPIFFLEGRGGSQSKLWCVFV